MASQRRGQRSAAFEGGGVKHGIVATEGAIEDFEINPSGSTGEINIPLGSMRLARATQTAELTGNLNAAGDVATQGSINTTQGLIDTSTAGAATAGTLLTDLTDSGGTPFFSVGDTVSIEAAKGGRDIRPAQFSVGATSTLGGADPANSLAAWLEAVIGIDTSAGVPGSPGITIDGATGALAIEGNYGEANDISDLVLSSSGSVARPFNFTKAQSATGESAYTPFVAYDSLGSEVEINATFVLESKSSTGNTWRWYVTSTGDSDIARSVGTGTVTFDPSGGYTSDSNDQIIVDRESTGAQSPLMIRPGLQNITQLASDESEVALSLQDGAPEGTLNEYAIGGNGIITGIFTNGMVADLAQIALATFSNNGGLFSVGDNLYSPGPNAGTAQVGTPGSFGAGTLVSGALEQSNVDLANEFVNLIVTQTGYTANSRVISSSNEMLTELLNTIR